jgi:hypothetical protein
MTAADAVKLQLRAQQLRHRADWAEPGQSPRCHTRRGMGCAILAPSSSCARRGGAYAPNWGRCCLLRVAALLSYP